MSEIITWVLTTVEQNALILLCLIAVLVMMVVSTIALRSARKTRESLRFGGEDIRARVRLTGRSPARHSELGQVRTPQRFDPPPGSVPLPFDGSRTELERVKKNMSDLRTDNDELREQILHLKNFNSLLPPMVKELNSEVNPENMGKLVLRAVERLFNPGQALVLLGNGVTEELRLVAWSGVSVPGGAFNHRIGFGIAGLAAAKKVTITQRDLANESNLVRRQLKDSDPIFKDMEIACPMRSRENCIGVICLGRLQGEAEEVRTALNMVGEMSGMALAGARQYQKIQGMANSDPLTGLVNKGYFLKACTQKFKEAQQTGKPLSIAMFDVDNFKHYNDLNGHLSGDQALIAIAEVLRAHGRPRDTVARFGGEEFILLMPATEHQAACDLTENIRFAVTQMRVEYAEKQPLGFLSVSGGVATVPQHGTAMADVIERADVAMYQAKKTGRNQVVSASVAARSMEMVSSEDA